MNKRAIVVDNGNVDWIPVKTGDIKRLLVPINSAPVLEYVDLRNIFNDREDGKELAYSVLKSSNPELVDIKINNSIIDIIIKPNLSGKTVVSFGALDKAGNQASANLEIVVVDPDKGDIALFKPVKALSIENDRITSYNVCYTKLLRDQWLSTVHFYTLKSILSHSYHH